MTLKQMALRHAGVCRVCNVELPAMTTAAYDFGAKNVVCLGCRDGERADQHESRPARPVDPADAFTGSRGEDDGRAGDRRRPAGSTGDSSASGRRAAPDPHSIPVG